MPEDQVMPKQSDPGPGIEHSVNTGLSAGVARVSRREHPGTVSPLMNRADPRGQAPARRWPDADPAKRARGDRDRIEGVKGANTKNRPRWQGTRDHLRYWLSEATNDRHFAGTDQDTASMKAIVSILAALLPVSSGVPAGNPAPADPPATPPGRPVGYPMHPSLSPDGATIVFSFGGDLWAVPSAGGAARRVTTHPSDELRSAFSPDGTTLAFESERDGSRNLYAMPVHHAPEGPVFGDVRRLTVNDRPQTLAGFSSDSARVLFSANLEPSIFRGTRMYYVAAAGPALTARLTDAWGAAPNMSADGASLLFTRNRFDPTRPAYDGPGASDIFRLDLRSGAFTRLTTHPANDADAFPLPDGSVAFVSARDGANNVWRLPKGAAGDADAQPLTAFKPAGGEVTLAHGVRDFSVAPGGSRGVFVVWDALHTIDLAAEKPQATRVEVAVAGDTADLDILRLNLAKQVEEAALSPDGKTIALAARGEVFVRSTEKDRPTRRVTHSHARERDLAWSPDGSVLFFASDESGVYGLYRATVDLAREDLQPPAKEGPKEPAAREEPTSDVKPAPRKPDHGKRWAESITFKVEPLHVTGRNDRAPLPSPDGKTLLFLRGRGDVALLDLAAKTERTILSGWSRVDAIWAPDSRHLIYSREDEFFNADLWLLDTQAAEPQAVNLTRHPDADESPRLSADGKVLYFLSDRDAASNGDMALYAMNLDRKLDGFSSYDLADYFKTAAENARKRKPLGVEEKPKKEEARTGTANDGNKEEPKKDEPKQDPPGATAAAATPPEAPAPADPGATPKTGPTQADQKEDSKPEAKLPEPLKFDPDDAYLRVRQILALPGLGSIEVTPGGERVLFSASIDGSPGLYSVDFKGKERKTVASGPASSPAVNLTGEKVTYLGGNEAFLGKPAGGETEKMAIDAPVTIEIEKQQQQKFLEAARLLGENFYHPTLKGLDWSALTQRYLALARQTRTDTEFNAVVNNLFGELDGSHLGIRGGRKTAGDGEAHGYLGVDVTPTPEGWRIARVLAQGPAHREVSRLAPGDVILAVNNRPAAAGGAPVADLGVLLAGTGNRETLLKVKNDQGAERLVLITPTGQEADSQLRYDDEVTRRKAMVERLSGGKLGYLHIRGMNLSSVRDFERDLYAAAFGRQGLLIDVRDNGGGSTTDILLASLTAPRHAYTVARGADPATMPRDAYPRDRRLIYAYNRPLSVLINQNSYSNAEIFAHAIKTTGRGKLVGVQTFGAVISTGAATLIDGTTVRLPTRGWHLPDGTDMEENGARPDLTVPMSPEAEVAGTDPQLEAAVTELLERSTREPFWSGKS